MSLCKRVLLDVYFDFLACFVTRYEFDNPVCLRPENFFEVRIAAELRCLGWFLRLVGSVAVQLMMVALTPLSVDLYVN